MSHLFQIYYQLITSYILIFLFCIQYIKAANALMGITFEINLDNAKKLAKAGKNGMKVGESK